MTLSSALCDLERYAFIWKLKLVHWIAEPFIEMDVEYACKRCYSIVRIFSKNLCKFSSSQQHYTYHHSNMQIKKPYPFIKKLPFLNFFRYIN